MHQDHHTHYLLTRSGNRLHLKRSCPALATAQTLFICQVCSKCIVHDDLATYLTELVLASSAPRSLRAARTLSSACRCYNSASSPACTDAIRC